VRKESGIQLAPGETYRAAGGRHGHRRTGRRAGAGTPGGLRVPNGSASGVSRTGEQDAAVPPRDRGVRASWPVPETGSARGTHFVGYIRRARQPVHARSPLREVI